MQPYEDKFDNRINIVNETLALYMLYFFQCLNDPSYSLESRTYISWGMLSTAGVLVLYNLIVIGR